MLAAARPRLYYASCRCFFRRRRNRALLPRQRLMALPSVTLVTAGSGYTTASYRYNYGRRRHRRHSHGNHIRRRYCRYHDYGPRFRLYNGSYCYHYRRRRHWRYGTGDNNARFRWLHYSYEWRLRLHFRSSCLPDGWRRHRRCGSCHA